MSKKLKILICPLNWGIGHATRCAPIIEQLILLGHNIIIASDGHASMVLKRQFPAISSVKLAPLDIKYSRYFFFGLAKQSLKILTWLRQDNRVLNTILSESKYDLIISDSRPAIHSKKIKSIFIISQPNPIIPWYYGSILIKLILNRIYRKYDEIWIPDLAGHLSLGGNLIEISKNINVKYIGWLSRLNINKNFNETKGKVLAIVSGPEPGRSLFVKKLDQMLPFENVIIVGGDIQNININLRYISYLNPISLSTQIESAEYIISRGGYSSLMDLAFSNKKLILVPTPGQTEQEYLAKRMADKKYAVIWDMVCDTWEDVTWKSDQVNRFDLTGINSSNDKSLLDMLMKLED